MLEKKNEIEENICNCVENYIKNIDESNLFIGKCYLQLYETFKEKFYRKEKKNYHNKQDEFFLFYQYTKIQEKQEWYEKEIMFLQDDIQQHKKIVEKKNDEIIELQNKITCEYKNMDIIMEQNFQQLQEKQMEMNKLQLLIDKQKKEINTKQNVPIIIIDECLQTDSIIKKDFSINVSLYEIEQEQKNNINYKNEEKALLVIGNQRKKMDTLNESLERKNKELEIQNHIIFKMESEIRYLYTILKEK